MTTETNVDSKRQALQDALSKTPNSSALLVELAAMLDRHAAHKLLIEAVDRADRPEMLWTVLAQHDEDQQLDPAPTVEAGLSKLVHTGRVSRAIWIECAILSEQQGHPVTAKAIINVTSQVGLKHDEMESEWSREFDQCVAAHSYTTARKVLENATDTFPASENLWRKWVQFETQFGTPESLQTVAEQAVANAPTLESEMLQYCRPADSGAESGTATQVSSPMLGGGSPRVVDEDLDLEPLAYNSSAGVILLPPPPPAGSSVTDMVLVSSDASDERSASRRGDSSTPGLTGLQNLGNTCFMNSALQCMSNTEALTLAYFLKGFHRHEINRDNPLGMKGAIADVFGELMEQMWAGWQSRDDDRAEQRSTSFYSSGRRAVAPRKFKMTISNFAPQFTGYAQHDSQELLAFLLDGLHEDLNRIRKKPYVETRDYDGRPDEVIAEEQWAGHKARNDSIIVDLFQGQYKSRLICDVCNKISIKFDPFMYLTLPIPVKNDLRIEKLAFIPRDPARKVQVFLPPKMRKLALAADEEPTIKHLRHKLGELHNVNPACLIVAEVFQESIYKVYADDDLAGEIGPSDDVFVWELSEPVDPLPPTHKRRHMAAEADYVPVFINHKRDGQSSTSSTMGYSHMRGSRFGVPLAVVVASSPAVLAPAPNRADYNDEQLWQAATRKHRNEWIRHIQITVLRAMERWTTFDFEQWEREQLAAKEKELQAAAAAAPPTDDEQAEVDVGEAKSESPAAPASPRVQHESPTNGATPSVDVDDLYGGAPPPYADSRPISPALDADDGMLLATDDPRLDYNTIFQMFGSSEGMGSGLQPVPTRLTAGSVLVAVWSDDVYQRVLSPESRGARQDVLGVGKWQEYEQFQDKSSKGTQEKSRDGPVTLDMCLDEFVKEEHLSESDPWYCGHCKAHQRARKKFDLWKMPDILVVHLKKFSQRGMRREKLDVQIDFPVSGLDLTSRVRSARENAGGEQSAGNPVYDLYAVSNHYGGLGGGHYTAYAQNPLDRQWYDFDDSSVSPISTDRLTSSAAYVLFYRRRNMTMPSLSFPLPPPPPSVEQQESQDRADNVMDDIDTLPPLVNGSPNSDEDEVMGEAMARDA
ncbi:hypothetical protein RI367_002125 [Sorochytrium milnesiophthora]